MSCALPELFLKKERWKAKTQALFFWDAWSIWDQGVVKVEGYAHRFILIRLFPVSGIASAYVRNGVNGFFCSLYSVNVHTTPTTFVRRHIGEMFFPLFFPIFEGVDFFWLIDSNYYHCFKHSINLAGYFYSLSSSMLPFDTFFN